MCCITIAYAFSAFSRHEGIFLHSLCVALIDRGCFPGREVVRCLILKECLFRDERQSIYFQRSCMYGNYIRSM